jgi:hypothetical protein
MVRLQIVSVIRTILTNILSQVQFDSGKRHPERRTACGKVILMVVERGPMDTAHRLTFVLASALSYLVD